MTLLGLTVLINKKTNKQTLQDAETMALAAEAAEKGAEKISSELTVLKVDARQSAGNEGVSECSRCGSSRHSSNAVVG